MPSLTDIAPATERVAIRDTSIEVSGCSAAAIAQLLQRFPEMRSLIAGKDVAVGPERIMELVPEAVAAIIAAGCGHPGDADHEQAAARLSAAEQLDLLEATLRRTMPDGLGPFVGRVRGLVGGLDVSGGGGRAPATSSRKPSKN